MSQRGLQAGHLFLTILLRRHVEANDVLPEEQKALRLNRRGCLDALLVDSTVAAEAKAGKRNLSVAWIDYSKVYDRVPHEWLLEMLDTIKAPEPIRRLMRSLLPMWRSTFSCGVR